MSYEGIKPLALSLRMRVAAWIAGAVLICGALLLGTLREGVRQALLHELDMTLQAEAAEILLEREQLRGQTARLHEIMELQARGHKDGAYYSQLLDDAGTELFATSTTPRKRPRPASLVSGQPESIDGYRILNTRSEVPSQGIVTVRVGTSLTAINTDMRQIDRLVGTSALVVLVAAPLAGFALATFALRPIILMSQRTSRLQPSRLEERLPLRGANDELDQLASVINGLLGRISQYVGEHRGLMADAAHQLRTPLAAIRSSVEVTMTSGEIGEENRESLHQVIEQIESLETLVNQLLLLAETEVQNLRQPNERVQLDDLLRRSLEMFEAVADSLEVRLQVGAVNAVEVFGNRHHYRQVINNLIDNALKFTSIQTAGAHTISVELVRLDLTASARLTIADTGIGIAPQHLPHIFGRFYRADSAQRSAAGIGGNGLGLSIVKSVVEASGGQIRAESKLGHGTSFIVTLPLAN